MDSDGEQQQQEEEEEARPARKLTPGAQLVADHEVRWWGGGSGGAGRGWTVCM